MTDPTHTPTREQIAAIISEARGACACFCSSPECADMKARTCPSVAALLACVERGLAPAEGEWECKCGDSGKERICIDCATAERCRVDSENSDLRDQLAAAEARAGKAESRVQDLIRFRDIEIPAHEGSLRVALSEIAAAESRNRELEGACRKLILLIQGSQSPHEYEKFYPLICTIESLFAAFPAQPVEMPEATDEKE